MRKNTLAFFVVMLAISFTATANTVSQQTAQTIALNFFKVSAPALSGHTTLNAVLKYTKTETDGTVDFYVFDISPVKGFVIVSADDNLKPVIGYSTESNFNTNFAHTNLESWVNKASSKIYHSIQLHVAANADISNAWSAYAQGVRPTNLKSNTVNPLLTTTWSQDPYYNSMCPYNTTDQQQCVTGCVATAMAQIMKYWNYPVQGKGSHSYTAYGYGVQSAEFDTTTYRWNQMPDFLTTSGNVSIATLMYQCGVSVDMNYGDMNQGGSGAFVLTTETWNGGPCAQSAFVNNFSYDPSTIQGVAQTDYSTADWINLLEAELNAGRVIQYEGDDASAGGHTWVCDGYDANDMVHMNWGWGGASNGFFDVTNLNAGGYNFNQNDAALIGIKPLPYIPLTAIAVNPALCVGSSTPIQAYGPAAATYTWTPTTGLACASCASTTATPAATTVYTVTVDSAGILATYNLVVTVNPDLTATTSSLGTSCYGSADGSSTVTPSGGTSNFSYHWSDGKTTQTIHNIAGGNYTVTVTDAKGCTASSSETVAQPPAINIVLTPANSHCGPADAILSAGVTGGAPSYFYQWSTGATTADVSGLATGTYTVTINDNHGCSASASTSITSTGSPVQIVFSTTVTDPTGGSNNGVASVTNISGGTPPYSPAQWSNGENTNTATDLAPGTYTVTVVDQNGCQQSTTITLTAVTGLNSVSQDIAFSVYPNPAKNEITVQLGKVDNGTVMSLKNVLGQTMTTQAVTGLQNKIDLSQFSEGVYFIELRQAEKVAIKEIVISK